jgi:hypothetical protein
MWTGRGSPRPVQPTPASSIRVLIRRVQCREPRTSTVIYLRQSARTRSLRITCVCLVRPHSGWHALQHHRLPRACAATRPALDRICRSAVPLALTSVHTRSTTGIRVISCYTDCHRCTSSTRLGTTTVTQTCHVDCSHRLVSAAGSCAHTCDAGRSVDMT